jgi:hypothetical protein
MAELTRELSSDPQIAGVDLESYIGRRYQLSDGKGNILEDSDTRDIFAEKALKLKQFKQQALDETLAVAPVVDQLNALAGRLSTADKSTVDTAIANTRTKYAAKKQLVLGALSLEELEGVDWDG